MSTDGGRVLREADRVVHRAHESDQFVMHDLDDLLSGRDAPEHFLAERAFDAGVREFLDDFVADIGFEQGRADFAQSVAGVRLADDGGAAQLSEDGVQVFRERFKHAAVLEGDRRKHLIISFRP